MKNLGWNKNKIEDGISIEKQYGHHRITVRAESEARAC